MHENYLFVPSGRIRYASLEERIRFLKIYSASFRVVRFAEKSFMTWMN